MSLLEDLAQNGISAEDLEKAAAVRLFEKVAAAEELDLNALTEEQVEAAFNHFVEEILPGLVSEEAEEAEGDAEGIDAEKAASVFLFQKVAEDDKIDLDAMNPEDVQELYNYFLAEVLPGMIGSDEEKKASAAEVEEAQAKLAEVEVLGRHMARSFHDEQQKIAAGINPVQAAKNIGQAGVYLARNHPGKAALIGAGGLATAGGAAYGAKKLKDKMTADKTTEASAPGIFDKLANERALEILQANGVNPETGAVEEPSLDDLVNARAIEMLQAAGYTFEE